VGGSYFFSVAEGVAGDVDGEEQTERRQLEKSAARAAQINFFINKFHS